MIPHTTCVFFNPIGYLLVVLSLQSVSGGNCLSYFSETFPMPFSFSFGENKFFCIFASLGKSISENIELVVMGGSNWSCPASDNQLFIFVLS